MSEVIIPPNSRESEQIALGSMLNSINCLNIGIDSLELSDFYYGEHRTIYAAMQALYGRDCACDVFLLCEELKRVEDLEIVGGPNFITGLAHLAGTSSYIEEYCRIIKGKALYRKMIDAARTIEKRAMQDDPDPEEVLESARGLLFSLDRGSGSADRSFREIVEGGDKSFFEDLKEKIDRFKSGDVAGINGISTHYCELDKLIDGLGNSNLIIIAARPSMGKTAFALNIAENIALADDLPVAIFSLEMSGEQLASRMISSRSRVPGAKLKSGAMTESEHKRVLDAAEDLSARDIFIEDCPMLTIAELRSRARRLKEAHNISALFIDYLQLLTAGKSGTDNRQQEVSDISRGLKGIARELNIPVIALSQLSRKVEERIDKRPIMSDLRESGAIEQDADVIIFLYRGEYYNPLEKPGLAQVLVRKNRHGAIGEVMLNFDKSTARFREYQPVMLPSGG